MFHTLIIWNSGAMWCTNIPNTFRQTTASSSRHQNQYYLNSSPLPQSGFWVYGFQTPLFSTVWDNKER